MVPFCLHCAIQLHFSIHLADDCLYGLNCFICCMYSVPSSANIYHSLHCLSRGELVEGHEHTGGLTQSPVYIHVHVHHTEKLPPHTSKVFTAPDVRYYTPSISSIHKLPLSSQYCKKNQNTFSLTENQSEETETTRAACHTKTPPK